MTHKTSAREKNRQRLSALGDDPDRLAGDIARAGGISDLARAFDRVQQLAARFMTDAWGHEDEIFALGRLVSDLRDRILVRVHGLALAETGPPPKAFCLLALGSEGRGEQYLATDQDNALVHAGRESNGTADFFEIYARRFVGMLLDLGIPPCPHGVMVSSAQWRMSAAEWDLTVDEMTCGVDEQGILKISVLLDMQPVAGDAELGWKLRRRLFQRVGGHPMLLRYMAREVLRFSPPLGLFNKFVVVKSGANKGCLDVKKGGIFPLIQGIRTLAAEHGILSTFTEDRILGLLKAGTLSARFGERIRDTYGFFLTLRNRSQVEKIATGCKPDNYIAPDVLSPTERSRLRACFEVVSEFQALLSKKYGLHLLT